MAEKTFSPMRLPGLLRIASREDKARIDGEHQQMVLLTLVPVDQRTLRALPLTQASERALTGGTHIVRQQACLTHPANDFRFISTVPGRDLTPATVEESKIHLKTKFYSVLKLITLHRPAQRLTKYFYLSLFFCFFHCL